MTDQRHAEGRLKGDRLASAHSPYLQQHAHNPVDWYPWGEEALERARREDRPLLVSIGYSTCHWCHVMARESFQDPETAAVMNEHFVNVKVDREQRPDLDRIYQRAHQLLTGRPGGWPLTLFLAPDQTPYFAGTYFPPEPRHGLPGFRELLGAAHEFYHRQRDRVEEQNAQVRDALARTEALGTPTDTLDAAPLAEAVRQAQAQYDRDHGGFGGAPKFPQPTLVGLLLHLGTARDDAAAREMALDSLRRMAASGLYDHLGGGFFRYCVDAEWSVPHFEKMLYDNALLLPLYADAWRRTGEPGFRRVVEETAAWVVREMEAPDGGYYAALDAESGGEEGAFYRWSKEEAQEVLDDDEYRVAARSYGLADPPNFEGHWHLRRVRGLAEVAGPCRMDGETAGAHLEAARRRLFEAREGRTRPGRDHKRLTAWNALMIKAMARAGRTLGRVDLVASAERALAAVRERAFAGGRLLADPDEGLPAYLDDHAFLLDAVLELLQARWRDADLALARTLADTLLARFADAENGGFFFTADDHEALLQRTRPVADDSLPAGNAVAARALARLGHIVGEPRYLEAAEGTVRGAWGLLQEYPHACAALTTALEELLAPPAVVVLRGDPETAAAWRDRLDESGAASRLLFTVPAGAEGPPGGAAPATGVSAQVCAGLRCLGPVEDEAALAELLTQVGNDAA